MTTQEIRIKMMKNHIPIYNLSLRIGCAPVQLDNWLSDDTLSDDIKVMIDSAIDTMLLTWKYGEAMEKTKSHKLIKPYMVEKYRKEKEKLECQ